MWSACRVAAARAVAQAHEAIRGTGRDQSAEDAQAGVTSFKTPLQPGTPTFSVARGGATVVSLQGGIEAVGAAGLPSHTLDLTYWSGSASKNGTCTITIP